MVEMAKVADLVSMPISVTGSKTISHQIEGFSLLELMLVLALIALVSAVILPNLFTSDEQLLQGEVRRLKQVLQMANRETRMSAIPIRWTAYEKSYLFERLNRDNTWHLLQDKPFKAHQLANAVVINEVQLQGESAFIPPTEEVQPELSNDAGQQDIKIVLGRIIMMPDGAVSVADVQLSTELVGRWLEVRPGMAGIQLRQKP